MAPWLFLFVSATPTFVVEGELRHGAAVEARAAAHWSAIATEWTRVTGKSPGGDGPIRIRAAKRLGSSHNGRSTLGVIELRAGTKPMHTEREDVALRHEVAHQFLLAVCPSSARDRLFHEAFAMLMSGESARWVAGPYESVARAAKTVERATSLDRPSARAAIARLLVESDPPGRAVRARFGQCVRGTWPGPMHAAELAGEIDVRVADAHVVLSRHSGAVLESAGAPALPMPFGSTLKPFVIAGRDEPTPVLAVNPKRWTWTSCHAQGPTMNAETALLLSCNGYFLDWAAREPSVVTLGRYRDVLQAFDVSFDHVTEVIGLRPTGRLSAFHLAQLYRVLGEVDPSMLRILRDNTRRGTLSGLGFGELDVATKTGTVRDSSSTPQVGWVVLVDDDVVIVVARTSHAPREFFADVVGIYERFRGRRDLAAIEVDVPKGEAKCLPGGLLVQQVDRVLYVDAARDDARVSFCLGSSTMVGAGVVENGRVRTTRRATKTD